MRDVKLLTILILINLTMSMTMAWERNDTAFIAIGLNDELGDRGKIVGEDVQSDYTSDELLQKDAGDMKSGESIIDVIAFAINVFFIFISTPISFLGKVASANLGTLEGLGWVILTLFAFIINVQMWLTAYNIVRRGSD